MYAYVCIYIYIYIYIYVVCMYAYIMDLYIHVHMCVRMHACKHTLLLTQVSIRLSYLLVLLFIVYGCIQISKTTWKPSESHPMEPKIFN